MTQNQTKIKKEEECDETILWRRVAENHVSRHKIETQKKGKWRERSQRGDADLSIGRHFSVDLY